MQSKSQKDNFEANRRRSAALTAYHQQKRQRSLYLQSITHDTTKATKLSEQACALKEITVGGTKSIETTASVTNEDQSINNQDVQSPNKMLEDPLIESVISCNSPDPIENNFSQDIDDTLIKRNHVDNVNCEGDNDDGNYWATNDTDTRPIASSSSKFDVTNPFRSIIRTRREYKRDLEHIETDMMDSFFSGVSDRIGKVDAIAGDEEIPDEDVKVFTPEFDVLKETFYDLYHKQNHAKLPSNANQSIINGVNTTVKDFAEQVSGYCAVTGIKSSHRDGLVNLLFKLSEGQMALPVAVTTKYNVVCKIDDYIPADWRSKQFQLCKKGGCCVFVGQYAAHTFCPTCACPRFYNCNRTGCGKPDPNCQCSLSTRKPQRILQYRSLVSLIAELLEYPQFLKAVKCIHKESKGFVRDIMGSENAQRNLEDMHSIYVERVQPDLTEINILFANYYDGTQPYRRSQQNFWPCLFSILNLPPSYRTRLAIGMFMTCLFTGTMDSASEVFLFRDLIVNELLALEKGISLEIRNKLYFVQARCLVYTFDTPAYAKVMKVKSSNSRAGCPLCHHGKGVNFPCYTSMKIIGTRNLLPLQHALRKFGQSGQCCKPGFYEYSQNATNEEKNKWMKHHFWKETLPKESIHVCLNKAMIGDLTPCCGINDTESAISLIHFLQKVWKKQNTVKKFDEVNHIWYHETVGTISIEENVLQPFISDLYSRLYYPHADFRTEEVFNRKTHDEILTYDKLRREGGLNDYNGVKGIPPMFCLKTFCSHEQMINDFWHTFMNWCTYLLDNLAGKRDYSACFEFNKASGCHPQLYSENHARPCWVLSSDEMNMVEACLNAIIYPLGYSGDYQIKSIFSKSGMLRGAAKIKILSTFLRLIISKTSIPLGYKLFVMLLQDDICRLLSPVIPKAKQYINLLHYRLIELVALYEGLFPISECNMIIHQIIHVAKTMGELGPIKGFWAAAAERSVGFVKNTTNKGGMGVEITVQKNYGAFEKTRMAEAYSTEERILLRESTQDVQFDINHPSAVSINDDTLVYDDQQSYFFHPIESLVPTQYEKRDIVYSLFVAINTSIDYERNDKRYAARTNMLEKSGYYRISFVYVEHLQEMLKHQNIRDLLDWFLYLQIYYHTGKDESNILNSLIVKELIEFTPNTKKIVYDDLQIINEILEFDISIYKDIVVDGIITKGRGVHCRETALGQRLNRRYGESVPRGSSNFYPSNSENNLKEYWSDRIHSSSWMCGYDHHKGEDYFCQLNFGIKIKCNHDELVRNQRILNIARRKHKIDRDQIAKVFIDCYDSGNVFTSYVRCNYIPIQHMYSTPVILLGMDKNDKPIMTKSFDGDAVRAIENSSRKQYYSSDNDLASLWLFVGNPERRILHGQYKLDDSFAE